MGLVNTVKELVKLAHQHDDTQDIRHTNQLGRVISRVNFPAPTSSSEGGDGGEIYNGMFKVIDSTTTGAPQVSVVDGNDINASIAGIAQINTNIIDVNKTVNIGITDDSYIILKAVYDGTNITTSIIATHDFTYSNNESHYIIARVLFNGTQITSIIQEHHGMIRSDILGAC